MANPIREVGSGGGEGQPKIHVSVSLGLDLERKLKGGLDAAETRRFSANGTPASSRASKRCPASALRCSAVKVAGLPASEMPPSRSWYWR
jgi:hypothetical protein